MSEELRLKKLRGSGGYVMARVSDEEQGRGNLGGPDLFLAPIGRIESARISKYHCNTCEKEYDSAPDIDYESPNEEVAENLILVEKGQYSCTTCGSTIAEYRDFKKPSETADVGVAIPETPSGFDYGGSGDVPSGDTAGEDDAPADDWPGSDAAEEESSDTKSVQNDGVVAGSADKVISIAGLDVYSPDARRMGKAENVGTDSSGNLVLVIAGDDGKKKTVPWKMIQKIGEIVILGETGQGAPAESPGCPGCGFENKPDSRFCEECGTKI